MNWCLSHPQPYPSTSLFLPIEKRHLLGSPRGWGFGWHLGAVLFISTPPGHKMAPPNLRAGWRVEVWSRGREGRHPLKESTGRTFSRTGTPAWAEASHGAGAETGWRTMGATSLHNPHSPLIAQKYLELVGGNVFTFVPLQLGPQFFSIKKPATNKCIWDFKN